MATGNINPLTSDFNFSMVFAFEENFDYTPFLKWMQGNWTLAFWYSALYVILIFGGKYYMQNRPRFEIRPALALWSAILAVFSIFGAIRTVPEIIYVLSKYGWEFSVCSPSYAYYNPTSFWTFMFAISKVYELGDTIFIVLRKQPLIFLHWYHHITTLIYCWYSYAEHIATGRWFIGMNYSIHAFMYTYYAFKAMRFHIPKCVSMAITSLQIMQMVVGTAVNVSAWQVKDSGRYCSASYTNLKFSFLMYFSYMALFCHFFYQVYINNAKASMAQSNTKTYLKPITPKNGFTERNGFPKMNGKNGYHFAVFDKKEQ